MANQNPYVVSVGSVSFGGSMPSARHFERAIAKARKNLPDLAKNDATSADQCYLECLSLADGQPERLCDVLALDYLPKSKKHFERLMSAGHEVARHRPRQAVKLVSYAYRAGEKEAARNLCSAICGSQEDELLVARVTSLILIHDQDAGYVVSFLSKITSNNPNKVNLLSLQAEYSNKAQREKIILNVPPITAAVLQHLQPERPISVLDGGATQSEIERQFSGWPPEKWRAVGFDPHPSADLSVEHAGNVSMIRTALGAARGKLRLYHTASDGASSIFDPNVEYLKHLLHGKETPLTDVMSVIGESEVDAIDLDTWRQEAQVLPFDFIKLNVQGAELEVLRGAKDTIEHCLGLQAEVSFAPIYRNAPVFWDIDAHLDGLGFTFFDMRKPTTNGRAASRSTVFSGSRVGLFRWPSRQLTEAHVLYLRDPFRPEEQAAPRWRTPQPWLRLAVVAELNGQVDFAMQLCETVLGRFADSFNDVGAALSKDLDAASDFYQEFDRSNR